MRNQENDQFDVVAVDTKFRSGYCTLSTVTFEARGPDGTMAPPTMNTVFDAKNGVVGVLYDPHKDVVLLTSEFRIATVFRDEAAWAQLDHVNPEGRPGGRLLGCVLGPAKPGQSFEDAARAEGAQESGCEIKNVFRGPTFFATGANCPNFVTAYALEFDSTMTVSGAAAGLVEEEGENIAVQLATLDGLREKLNETRLDRTMDGISQTAAWWFLANQPRIKAEWLGSKPELQATLLNESRNATNNLRIPTLT